MSGVGGNGEDDGTDRAGSDSLRERGGAGETNRQSMDRIENSSEQSSVVVLC